MNDAPHCCVFGEDPKQEPEEYEPQKVIKKLIIVGVLFFVGIVFHKELHNSKYVVIEYGLFLSAYFIAGLPVISTALRNIFRGRVFDENFLMTVSTFGAIAIHKLPEAVGVMLFYAVGELFQDISINRSRRSISELMDIRPDYANLLKSGVPIKISPFEVKPGHLIEIRPGEKIPLDGEVVSGSSYIETSMLTGESRPRLVQPGDKVLAGVINTSGLLRVRVSRVFKESSVAKILKLVQNASTRKSITEKFITQFAAIYTPIVVAAALIIALVPPLIISSAPFSTWIYRALVLLVISCPCALVVSIPLGYFVGIGEASRSGILIKGANFLDALTHIDTFAFDKTGTLTKGIFKVDKVVSKNGFNDDELLYFASMAEVHSSHPIGKSIIEAYGKEIDAGNIEHYQDIKGYGIIAKISGKRIIVGNDKLLHKEKIVHEDCHVRKTIVYVVIDDCYAGYITLGDEIRDDVIPTLRKLGVMGLHNNVMLTGDDETTSLYIAKEIGITRVYAELLPEEKVEKLEELQRGISPGKKLIFVGDGINDAPVITRADIGVAMGGLGSDAAIEAADIVLMEDKLEKLPLAIEISLKTRRIVLQNIFIVLIVKTIFLVAGATGQATMWQAVFADVGVSLLSVFNSMRILKSSPYTFHRLNNIVTVAEGTDSEIPLT